MRHCKTLSTLICLLTLILVYQTSDAQQSLAQQAYAIFEQSCLDCHGEQGTFKERIIIEYTALIETGAVVPGKPLASELFKRLWTNDLTKRMPLGKPRLSATAIQTVAKWIQVGAPNWEDTSETDRAFITPEEMLETIENHINSLPASDRSFTRYFTLTHLYNAGETSGNLRVHQNALSKLINSLSWGSEVIKPKPIDAEETILYIDLRHYDWDIDNNTWYQIERTYPYSRNFASPTYTTLRHEMDCEVPFVRADWFIATASLPPLYHEILDLPGTDTELEAQLGVNVAKNLENALGVRVWRAGFNNSRVAKHNRIVERHQSRYGAYWKSYDFAGDVGTQDIFTHPLDFKHDGGEIIFNLPNGLQAYYLSDATGNRLDEAPTKIVSDPGVGGPEVRNGLSCMGCHANGMRTFEDQVRGSVEKNPDPPFNRDRVLLLYVEQPRMDALVEEDTDRYRQALEAAGGVFGEIDPIQQLVSEFEGLLDANHAAAEVGLATNDFLKKVNEDRRLRNLGLLAIERNGISRDKWRSHFSEVISVLDLYSDNVQGPDDELGVPNTSLEISMPDENLRTAVRKALGLVESETITKQKMQELTTLFLNTEGTSDFINLEGLEHATNLTRLSLRVGAGIKDIAPLKGLTDLTSLFISANVGGPDIDPLRFSDITPLQDMTALTSLTLHNIDQISDLTPLRRLTDLTFLRLSGNQINDITPLQNLTALTQLHVESNQISDITPLQNLTRLSRLNLSWNRISNVAPLENLTRLQKLSISNNPIEDEDLAPLRRLKEQNPSVEIDIDINVDVNHKVLLAPTTPVLPAETALLSNYPNPFNPETWIPYQLVEAVEVTVTIYDVKGIVVRQLALGHRLPGFYYGRGRAAHWDGRNQHGEPVVSGIYFYTLTVGDFTATRKMLIIR